MQILEKKSGAVCTTPLNSVNLLQLLLHSQVR